MAFHTQRKITMTKSKLYVKQYGAYWKNAKGQTHREDGPAYEYATGTKVWYLNGDMHREDGPAFEEANGYKRYYLNDGAYSEEDYNAKNKLLR